MPKLRDYFVALRNNMETLAKVCDALKCEITDVIELTEELPKEGE